MKPESVVARQIDSPHGGARLPKSWLATRFGVGRGKSPGAGANVLSEVRFHSTNGLTVRNRPFTFNRMVELQTPPLDAIFHALGDSTRRRMLRELSDGERTVSQLAKPFAMSLAAASKHIKALEKAGLIHREVRGRTHLCRLDPGPLESVDRWLSFYERFWTDRLDALERLLRE
jgi:DNA-binding transcriptional ArsR family regulator